jgi:hypothetical protein
MKKQIPAKLNNDTAHNSHRTIHNNKKQHSAKLTDTTPLRALEETRVLGREGRRAFLIHWMAYFPWEE